MNDLSRLLREEIVRGGPISFADYMRSALYDSRHGYYGQAGKIGKTGDFFTSVSVGVLFGELLAFQFARWIETLPAHVSRFQCVEAGADDGRLARDILETFRRSEPHRFKSLQYWILEPLPAHRALQQKTLADFPNVRWFDSPTEIRGRVEGVLFSNELLDAMPVHVFRWDRATREWHERGVDVSAAEFIWVDLKQSVVEAPTLPNDLLDVLPDGYTVERALEAARWWEQASEAIVAGKLMTIDYGGVREDILSPRRSFGSLRGYSRHFLSPNVLDKPGEQDITAHVDFTELQLVGTAAGLKTETFTTQGQFLTTVAREMWKRTGLWSQERTRQFQTLTHPEHLGRPFRVLVQAR